MRFNTQAFRARLAFNTVGVTNSSSSFAKPSGSNIKELSSFVSSSSTKLQRFFSKVSVPRNERLAAFDSSISNTEHSSLPNRCVSKQSRLFSTVESLDVKGGVETKPVVEKETSSSEPKKREGGYKSSEPKFQNELERLLFVAGSNSKYSFFLPKLGLETSADLLQYVEKALGAASKQERTRFYQKALDTMASYSGVHFPLSNMMVHLLSTEYAENQLAAAELYDLVSSRQLFYSLGRKTFKVTKGLLLNEYIKTNKREELVQKFFKDCEASSAGDVGKLLIESERGVHYLVSLVHFAEPKDQVKLIELILGNIVGAAKNETFRMTLLELVKDVKSNPSSALKPVIDKVFDSMQEKAVELVSTREGLDFTLKFFENGSPERLTTFLPVILPQLEQLCLEPKSRGLILFLLKNLEVPQKVELINALGEHLDCLSEGFGGVSIVIEILTQTKTHNICPDVSMKASDFVLKKSESKASGSGGVALAKVIESGSEEGKERAMKFIKSDRFGSRAQDASAIQAALLSTDENTRLDVLQKLVAQLDEITTETQFHFKLDTILKDRAICDTFVTLPDGTSQKFIDIVFQKYAGDATKFIGYSRGQFSSYIIEQLIKQADNAQIAQFRGYIFGSREVPKDQNYTVLKQLFDFHSGPYIVKHLLKRDVNNLNRQADLAVLAEIFGDVCMKPDSAQFYEDILDTTIYAPEEYMNKVFVPRVLENYAKLMETPGEAPQKYLVKHALHFKYLKHADKIELMKIVRKKNLLPQMLNDPHPWGQFALLNMVRPPGSLRYDAARERSFFAEVLGLGKSIADFMVDKAKSGDKTPIPSAFADRVIGTEERAKRLYQDLCGYNPREINNEILTHWEKYDDMFGDKDIEEVLVILYDNCTESKQAEFKTKYEGKVAIW